MLNIKFIYSQAVNFTMRRTLRTVRALLMVATVFGASSAYSQDVTETGGVPAFSAETLGLRVSQRLFRDSPTALDTTGVRPARTVSFKGPHPAGSIVVDQNRQYVYFVLPGGQAIEYVAAMGRPGRLMSTAERFVSSKIVNPEFFTPDSSGGYIVSSGPASELGPRAIILALAETGEQGSYAFHGWRDISVFQRRDGQRLVSGGCVRMPNDQVIDLYRRVKLGTIVYTYNRNEVGLWVQAAPRPSVRQ